ncbi:MAG TPA: type II secretion system protein [Candidatus Saccharibacteria bacterium]|nr:type II secretion system protein [Candidatus Saccharibacteria bacterium]HRQ06989.1 type II secretion system protein [Candidatus Saccharibacteria bacterium]
MNVQQKEKGFTIIEVVLVLAIAGLIFLMVFIALPALQRSQRDSQRKNDLSRAQTALTNYSSVNRGTVPKATVSDLNNFTTSFLKSEGDSFADPSGSDYIWDVSKSPKDTIDASFSNDSPKIYYILGAKCGSDGAQTESAGSRIASMQMVLEGGGVACVNN